MHPIRPRLLIVDDEPGIRFGLQDFLEGQGYEVAEAGSAAEALAQVAQAPPDLVLLDHQLPDATSLEVLPQLLALEEGLPIFVLTAHGTIDLAVKVVKAGAEQFLTKPVELPSLLVMIQRTLEVRQKQRLLENRACRNGEPDPFFGTSRAIRALKVDVERLLPSELPILILGETGSGKSLLARWIHLHSPRAEAAFLDLNCAGLNRDFLETELFGHEKGAFTGATQAKTGLLEVAHQGTVFLDEVGDMDPSIQVKLLKVLEERRFRRMGSLADRRVDIRLIAATHQNLDHLIQVGRFRSDLYFRLNALTLRVPPLRERREDVPLLAQVLLQGIARDLNRPVPPLSREALDTLAEHTWPGNIRELRNALERVCLYATGREIQPTDFALARVAVSAVGGSGETLEEVTQAAIAREIQVCGGNISEAARRLGIARSTIYQKLKSPTY